MASDCSTPPRPLPPVVTPAAAPVNLSTAVTTKLTDKNFLIWKQHVESVIKASRLEQFVACPRVPPRFLSDADQGDKVNPEFLDWEQQDQYLFSWLLTTLSDSVLPRVVGCVHLYQIWDEGHTYFNSQTTACSR